MVLLANKSDLAPFRQVATEEGETLANLWDIPFVELSTKNDSAAKISRFGFPSFLNIPDNAFKLLVKEIYKAQYPKAPTCNLCSCIDKISQNTRNVMSYLFLLLSILCIVIISLTLLNFSFCLVSCPFLPDFLFVQYFLTSKL